MRLRLTPLAAQDVAEVREQYSEVSAALGTRLEAALDSTFARLIAHPLAYPLAAVEPLTDFPEMGRKVPEAGSAELRELLVYRYRIIYRRLGERIAVLTIVHGSRDLARLLGRER